MAAIQYTFTHKQYTERHKTNNTQNNTKILEECGPCAVFVSFALAFALQLRKKHWKPSVRVAEECRMARWRYRDVTRLWFVVCYRRFGTIYRSNLQGFSPAWPLKVGLIRYTETSVRNYPWTPLNLKSRIMVCIWKVKISNLSRFIHWTRADKLWCAYPKWHAAFSIVPFFFFLLPDQRLHILKTMCVYKHISDCIETVYELPLLPNNTAVKHSDTILCILDRASLW